jgi:hypothetical protein
LLRFELIELPLLPVDLGLLRLKAPLSFFVLFLPGLHLITDQRAAEESHRSADTRAGASVSGSASDDRA